MIKVAIVHYWLVGMRGGEKVVEALCEMFPQADIFTHVYVPDAISETIRRHTVKTSFINRLPASARRKGSFRHHPPGICATAIRQCGTCGTCSTNIASSPAV